MSLHHLTPTHVHATPLRLHDRQAKRQEAGKPEHREQACTIRRDHAQTGQASAGRTSAPLVPAAIRVTGVSLEPEHRDYIRKRLGSKLGKYATSIATLEAAVNTALQATERAVRRGVQRRRTKPMKRATTRGPSTR